MVGDSNVVMAPFFGNRHGTCSIEILTTANVKREDWVPFCQSVLDKWAEYKDRNGQYLNIRPHWAKEWQDLKVRAADPLMLSTRVHTTQCCQRLMGSRCMCPKRAPCKHAGARSARQGVPQTSVRRPHPRLQGTTYLVTYRTYVLTLCLLVLYILTYLVGRTVPTYLYLVVLTLLISDPNPGLALRGCTPGRLEPGGALALQEPAHERDPRRLLTICGRAVVASLFSRFLARYRLRLVRPKFGAAH